jgi:hypothetical protein
MSEKTILMVLNMVNEFLVPMAEKYVEQSKNEYDDMALAFTRGGINELIKFLNEQSAKAVTNGK